MHQKGRPRTHAVRVAARRSLLVVDDDGVNRAVVQAMVGALDYAVQAVDGGHAALVAAASRPFDAILMDIRMRGLDGCETTRLIRSSRGPNARTPVLAITATTTFAADVEHWLATGMDDVLAKPVSLETLERALNRWIRCPLDDEPAQVGSASMLGTPVNKSACQTACDGPTVAARHRPRREFQLDVPDRVAPYRAVGGSV